jgi:aminoglycoside phosphotransferase (APT) family kinase protein
MVGMPSIDDARLRWAVAAAAPGADVVEVRGLRDGGSPWLLRLSHDGRERGVVLRVGRDPEPLRTEAAALRLAQRRGVPAPRLVAVDLGGELPAVLAEQLAGSSAIPRQRPRPRLRALGAAAAALHAIPLAPGPALPRRDRPIPAVDFTALRREYGAVALLAEAERAIDGRPVPGAEVFVHGDLWQGNVLWAGDALVGLVDWDCAGAGPAGVDIGSLRCDAALCFGVAAAADILRGWEGASGRPAQDVAYWDVVAALSTPPDMGWFTAAIAGQNRPDLDQPTLLGRRDAFLRDALDRLAATDPG